MEFLIIRGKSLSDIESLMGLSGGGAQLSTSTQPGSKTSAVLMSEIELNKEQLQRERYRRKVQSMASLSIGLVCIIYRYYIA